MSKRNLVTKLQSVLCQGFDDLTAATCVHQPFTIVKWHIGITSEKQSKSNGHGFKSFGIQNDLCLNFF